MTLAGAPGEPPAPWVPLAGALLGVGAHLVNALPDLDDDAATGVHGLPHRLGARRAGPAATVVLVAASVLIALNATGSHRWLTWLGLPLVVVLAAVGLRGRGRTPFRAAVAITLLDVALLAGARSARSRRTAHRSPSERHTRHADPVGPRHAARAPLPAGGDHRRVRERDRRAARLDERLLRRFHANAGVRQRHLALPLEEYAGLGDFGRGQRPLHRGRGAARRAGRSSTRSRPPA